MSKRSSSSEWEELNASYEAGKLSQRASELILQHFIQLSLTTAREQIR